MADFFLCQVLMPFGRQHSSANHNYYVTSDQASLRVGLQMAKWEILQAFCNSL